MKIIEYNGKTLETKHFCEISQKEYEEIKNAYYKKPDFADVKKEFLNLKKGGVKNSNITNYYVKDLMAKTHIYYNKWSIEEVLNCKELVGFFISKTQENKKIYPDSDSIVKKIETAFRLGGKGVCSKPANFPIKTVDEILNNYNINDNYYDFSCGWGARLCSSLKNEINYYGTDPNYMLTERLINMANDYKKVNNTNTIVDIKTQGSEVFVPEWENKIGVAFSSPPYFYLEDYKVGNQSYKNGTTYEDWKSKYLEPTFKNIYKYLVEDGYFIININNFLNYELVEDTIKIAENNGFTLYKYHTLSNIKRTNSKGGFNDNSEKIIVFIKSKKEKIMDFNGKVKSISVDGLDKVNITISTENSSILEQLEDIKNKDKEVSIEIKRMYNRRSLDANAYFHFLINKLARYFNISDEEMKVKMNLQYGTIAKDKNGNSVGIKIPISADINDFYHYAKWFGDCVENGIKFNKYLFYKETHKLNTKEMSDLIEGVVQECRDYGIPTKTDEEIDSMLENWKPKGG